VTVSMPVPRRAVSVWDVSAPGTGHPAEAEAEAEGGGGGGDGGWVVSLGSFKVMVGASSCDIRTVGTLHVTAA
jgi:hypothetical protein